MEDAVADAVGGGAAGALGDEVALDGHGAAARLGLPAEATALATSIAARLPPRLRPLPAGRRIGAVETLGGLGKPARAVAAEAALGLDHLDVRLRQFVDEARGDRRLPERVHAPVLRERDVRLLPRPRDADVGETALLLEASLTVLIHGALVREQALLPARQIDGVELEPLRRVQRHQADAVAVLRLVGIHDQGDVLEEGRERVELLHEAHELLQVLELGVRLRALVLLPHGRVAGFVQDHPGEVDVLRLRDEPMPAVDR